MGKAQDVRVFINLAVSARVGTQFCFNSSVFTIRNGPVGWVGERKGSLQVRLSGGQHTIWFSGGPRGRMQVNF